jgi:hypothetical protein
MSYIGTFGRVHADWLLSLDEPRGSLLMCGQVDERTVAFGHVKEP